MNSGEARDVARELRSWAAAILGGDTAARCQVVHTDAESMLAVAKHLDALADDARRCWRCRSWRRKSLEQGTCHRYPQVVSKSEIDFCDEFDPQEVTP